VLERFGSGEAEGVVRGATEGASTGRAYALAGGGALELRFADA
jgi:hypothetical protein